VKDLILKDLNEHKDVLNMLFYMQDDIAEVAKIFLDVLKNGNKILIFGNGGSAGDAQHISAELTGRFVKERKALPAIALTTDTSAITAIANDYSFDKVFSRQIEALAKEGDLAFGISTSGNSKNVIEGLKIAKSLNCITIGLSGRDGGVMSNFCDKNLIIKSNTTARIQEMHILIGHMICSIIDEVEF